MSFLLVRFVGGEIFQRKYYLLKEILYLDYYQNCRLKNDGYWADFIDPSAGVPYFGQHTNTTMFETDEKYRLLGFRIEDLGCCKVICHKDFGRKVFVGTLVTSVPTSTGVIQELFKDLNIASNLQAFLTAEKQGDSKMTGATFASIHFD